MRICLKIKWAYNSIILLPLTAIWLRDGRRGAINETHLGIEFLNPVKQPMGFELAVYQFNSFQHSVEIHIETSHLICATNQMTGFHMKWNTGLN